MRKKINLKENSIMPFNKEQLKEYYQENKELLRAKQRERYRQKHEKTSKNIFPRSRIKYWLDWGNKTIRSNSPGLNDIPWSEVEKYPIAVFCSQNDWPYIEIEEKDKKIIADEKERVYKIGRATIKEMRRGTEENPEGLGTQALKKCWELCPYFIREHPSHSKEVFTGISDWVYSPRFENLQQGTFKNIHKIDIKSCYANIMRDYPLPYGEPTHIKDPDEIAKQLQAGKSGFVRFYLKNGAKIKKEQIPFVSDCYNEIKGEIRGRLLLYTRLFRDFSKQYKIIKPIIYTDFWIFEEKKGCVDKFLDYCNKLKEKKETEKTGKMLANAFYGAVGKGKFGGYNYRTWTAAVSHIAALKTYYLYRQFKKENVLAIRSDCIYVKGELPGKFLKEKSKYHITKYQQVSFDGEENIFIHDTNHLLSFLSSPALRSTLISQLAANKNK
ncbi:MAG: hypothetical protein MRERV_55c007 [Mycoplasmataceae bacterium RV_VA103A]|nr:MAG: hypothetical protein MRERV_55c007 [Mycoplasmataceae bacterium RV_VA103A]